MWPANLQYSLWLYRLDVRLKTDLKHSPIALFTGSGLKDVLPKQLAKSLTVHIYHIGFAPALRQLGQFELRLAPFVPEHITCWLPVPLVLWTALFALSLDIPARLSCETADSKRRGSSGLAVADLATPFPKARLSDPQLVFLCSALGAQGWGDEGPIWASASVPGAGEEDQKVKRPCEIC